MSVTIEPQYAALITGGAVLLLLGLLSALTVAALAVRQGSRANGELSKTLITFNNELQDAARDRVQHARDREMWQREKELLKVENASLKRSIAEQADNALKQRREAEETKAKLATVEAKLAEEQAYREKMGARLDALERAGIEKDGEIAALKQQLRHKDEQIASLERQLASARQEYGFLNERFNALAVEHQALKKQHDVALDGLSATVEEIKRDTGLLPALPESNTPGPGESKKPHEEEGQTHGG